MIQFLLPFWIFFVSRADAQGQACNGEISTCSSCVASSGILIGCEWCTSTSQCFASDSIGANCAGGVWLSNCSTAPTGAPSGPAGVCSSCSSSAASCQQVAQTNADKCACVANYVSCMAPCGGVVADSAFCSGVQAWQCTVGSSYCTAPTVAPTPGAATPSVICASCSNAIGACQQAARTDADNCACLSTFMNCAQSLQQSAPACGESFVADSAFCSGVTHWHCTSLMRTCSSATMIKLPAITVLVAAICSLTFTNMALLMSLLP